MYEQNCSLTMTQKKDSWCYEATTADGDTLYLMVPARGWTTYTIEKAAPADKNHGNKDKHEKKNNHNKEKHNNGKNHKKQIFEKNECYTGFFPINPNDSLH